MLCNAREQTNTAAFSAADTAAALNAAGVGAGKNRWWRLPVAQVGQIYFGESPKPGREFNRR
jgi:hypothetical protein